MNGTELNRDQYLPATLAGACPGLTNFVSSTRDTRRCLPGSYHLRELYPRHSPVPARVLPSSRALPATLAGACPGLTNFVSSIRDTRRCLPGSYHLRELYPRHSPVPARALPSSVRKGEEGRSKRDCPAVILAPPLAAPSSVVPAETSYKGRYGWGRTSRVNQHVPVPENYAETKTQLSIPLTKLPQSPIVTTSTPYALQNPPA
uniref:Uncharacterized protein n=2 Tax=Branchiostoma floridae TaxID=7739 RepID=C3YEY3_BRAFL|eukprot:XP_002605217.1 hypothetical protein BRAFLDRAFT_122698 [Branchiostoma floridae]